MKSRPVCLFLFLITLSALSAADSPDTWTNQDGQTMTATVTAVEERIVVFERDGQTFRYPIANLVEEDQQRVRERAEQLAEQAKAEEAREKVARELRGNLVGVRGRRVANLPADTVEDKTLFALYYSAAWCGPCRNFTPRLVDFYGEMREKHPDFEIILVSRDSSPSNMEGYMRDFNIPWPAVRHNRINQMDLLKKYSGSGIPNLVFIDGGGEVLSSSYVNGRYRGPTAVMRDIRRHLETQGR